MDNNRGTGEDEKPPCKSNVSVPGTTQTHFHVGARKKGKYNGDDPVDTYLLNQIAKHVKFERLGALARDLNIEKSVYNHIENPDDKIWEVSRKES